jgi:hypothetical protein
MDLCSFLMMQVIHGHQWNEQLAVGEAGALLHLAW